MTIQNYLKDVNYTISGNLSYGDLAFNYNSTSADLSDLEQYKFVFTKAKNTSDVYTVNNIFNANLYDTVLKMITGIKYTTKQTHISDIYNFYDYDGLRVIVPTATWYDFLVINDNKTISIVSKKHDYSIYILRDLIKSQLENNGGVLFHSAAITKDNDSILIIGNKGAGKSTFAFGMAAAFDYQLISNDRTYLGQNDLLTSFPIDIRLGKGTIDNNVKLKQMVDGSPKFTHEFASLQANEDKLVVYPYDIDKTIPMINDSNGVKLSYVVIPQFDKELKTDSLQIAVPENMDYVKQIIQNNCLTPNDPIWLQSLLGKDKYSKKELTDMANARIDYIMNNMGVFVVKYKTITRNTKIVSR